MQEPEVTSEAAVNEAAAAEVAASKAEVAAPATEQVAEKTVAEPASVQKTVPQNNAPTASTFNPQELEDLKKQIAEQQKINAETRKWATQQSQMRAQYEKDLANVKKEMEKRLAEITEEPFNLEKFNQDFVKNGFKAFDPYLEKKLSSLKEHYEPTIAELRGQNEQLQTNMAIMSARSDSTRYPDFADLEPKMVEILNSPNCPIDRNLPLDQKLDAVYQLAKTQNSTEAIKAAKNVGYQKAQADLAKEARSAVATGGKGVSASPADYHTMPLDQLEKLAIKLHGVADRD